MQYVILLALQTDSIELEYVEYALVHANTPLSWKHAEEHTFTHFVWVLGAHGKHLCSSELHLTVAIMPASSYSASVQ